MTDVKAVYLLIKDKVKDIQRKLESLVKLCTLYDYLTHQLLMQFHMKIMLQISLYFMH